VFHYQNVEEVLCWGRLIETEKG